MTQGCWLISGCSGGFGQALAHRLLESGECVALTARDPRTLDALVDTYPETTLPLRLDVTEASQIDAAVAAATQRFGTVGALVNNAGGGHMGTIETAPLDDARAMMELNYFGALALIKAVLPAMVRRRAGTIVNVGSVAGEVGFPAIGYYSAAKFALAGMTEALAAEVAPLGITVTNAELGPFATNFAGAMRIVPPPPHYDLAALSREAGNSGWSGGDDPDLGVRALLAALADPAPPRRLVLGAAGLEVVELHQRRRAAEADRWRGLSELALDQPVAG